ncbi:hypothetical protein Hypma_001546 [Hypsizygus marmoreus]|uniref:Uncharacterized protein n=1 Tax=Hypsizygus marmoreus TaxID=39966 RepID=A0A369K5Z7_HYPMA|nr:hypothetical protein Hypma_001546 [Hypsizygus marmoreus]
MHKAGQVEIHSLKTNSLHTRSFQTHPRVSSITQRQDTFIAVFKFYSKSTRRSVVRRPDIKFLRTPITVRLHIEIFTLR